MSFKRLIKPLVLIFICILTANVSAIEPITTGIAVGAAVTMSAILAGYDTVKCTMYECCDQQWTSPNLTGK